jgi:uncharacterized protein YcaQ
MRISRAEARRLALHCQGLDGSWDLPAGKEGIAQTVERLGYVQIDTIAVVQRAHHHTLWARRPDYAPEMLDELQAVDRRVFEWWAPAASYLPMCDYRYYMRRMRATTEQPRRQAWAQEHAALLRHVHDRIRDEGALGARDFEAPEGFQRGSWWSWKPAKRALEALFDSGELMVTERRGFERIYDLRERVLPPGLDTREPDLEEQERFEVRRALGGFGFAPVDDIRPRHWSSQRAGGEAVAALIESGEVATFQIEGEGETAYCALCERLEKALAASEKERAVHVLSPFDNLVIRRRWLESFFGFDYRLEAYKPAEQREYGYFSLPILWGERFVGRVDAKADRKPETLIVRRLVFEPGFEAYDALLLSLAAKLWAFAAFNGCERIAVEEVVPAVVEGAVEEAIEARDAWDGRRARSTG